MSVVVTGTLDTTAPVDVYPTHNPLLGLGGKMEAGTIAIRNAIPVERRTFGMLVTVNADGTAANNKTYILANVALGGTNNTLSDNANWIDSGSSITSISVANTAFLSKSGDDATALVERFDKPFLTIAALNAAMLAAYPLVGRTAGTRRLLGKIVGGGNWNEQLVLQNLMDWDIGNATIDVQSGAAYTITDNSVACDSIIYGFGKILRSTAGTLGCVSILDVVSNVIIYPKIESTIASNPIVGNSGTLVLMESVEGATSNFGVSNGGVLTLNGDVLSSGDAIASSGSATINSRSVTSLTANALSPGGGASTTITVNGSRLVTTGTDQNAVTSQNNGGTLIFNGVTFIATGTGYSVEAITPTETILIYGACQSNATIGANVIEDVGTINVSASVI